MTAEAKPRGGFQKRIDRMTERLYLQKRIIRALRRQRDVQDETIRTLRAQEQKGNTACPTK